jgi:hypothetical protein
MTAAWRLSVATLSQQLPQAMELLRCCAFFGPEAIPRDLFRRVTRDTDTRVSNLLADPILLARAIRELGRFALVRIDGRTILLHRLIQALLRADLDPAEQASYQHEVHLILAAASPKNPDDNRRWPRFEELVAHVSSPVTELAQCPDPPCAPLAWTSRGTFTDPETSWLLAIPLKPSLSSGQRTLVQTMTWSLMRSAIWATLCVNLVTTRPPT